MHACRRLRPPFCTSKSRRLHVRSTAAAVFRFSERLVSLFGHYREGAQVIINARNAAALKEAQDRLNSQDYPGKVVASMCRTQCAHLSFVKAERRRPAGEERRGNM